MMQPLWRTMWRILKKLNIELPCYPAIPLLGIYPKKTKSLIKESTCIPVFTATLVAIAKAQKQLKCPSTDKWVKKMLYIIDRILLSHK